MGFEVIVKDDFDPSDSVYLQSIGRYHFAVVDVDEDGLRLGDGNDKGSMIVVVECLAGSVPNQEGLQHKIYFTKSKDAAWRILRFSLAVGLITAEEIEKCKASGKFPMIEFARDAKGRQFFGELEENDYNNKITAKIKGGFFHLASKQCTDKVRWPRNEAMVAKSGVKMPESKPVTKPNEKPAAKPTADDDLLGGVQL